ncbi:MAG: hypothetical protein BWK76_20170 [Desulfobulbaceae bacterium A2]|nr:MAG: hypothetical protein BWK76_20170 [Desulfobulbaceae bacterium A2]
MSAPASPARRRYTWWTAASLALALLCGCATRPQPPDLTIAHINDHHSHLNDAATDLSVGGENIRVRLGGFARVTAAMRQVEATESNLLKLHAGDATTGTLYYTLFKGGADADLMHTVCFDAMVPGNHEFDEGDERLAAFITRLRGESCHTPMVSSNIQPQEGTPLAPAGSTGLLIPWIVKEVGGEMVGIVGLTTVGKTTASSRPLPTTRFEDEAEAARRTIALLTEQGVHRIVLLTHIGYKNDVALAAALPEVDVIIGGDSHTLLGDFSPYGIESSGPYPTVVKNRDGDPVCIGQAWEYAKTLGLMRIHFDAEGRVRSCTGEARLLLDEPFSRRDAQGRETPLDDSALAEVRRTLAADRQHILLQVPDREAEDLLSHYAEQLRRAQTEIIGTAAEVLCFERIPGLGASKLPGCAQATRSHGADITNLVAQAFRQQDPSADIALQNAGGTRSDLPAGPISVENAYTLLPFANTLVELRMSGAEIRQTLEEAVDYALRPEGSSGAYPYAAGLRWNVDLSQPAGQRVSAIEFKGREAAAWAPLNVQHLYTVVTNSYIAQGKDGYESLQKIRNDGRVQDTYLDYAQAFLDYVRKSGTLRRLPTEDYSTREFRNANGLLQ